MSGSHHFYYILVGYTYLFPKLCQCPMSGSHHFYSFSNIDRKATLYCVNALCRAHIISTLPFQNLSIYAGFMPCFFVYFSEFSDFLVQ